MNKDSYRLYVGKEKYYFSTFEEAKEEAQKYTDNQPELRIEILIETKGADF